MGIDTARSRVDPAPGAMARAQARAVIQLCRCQGRSAFLLLRDLLGPGIDPDVAAAFREIERQLELISRRVSG